MTNGNIIVKVDNDEMDVIPVKFTPIDMPDWLIDHQRLMNDHIKDVTHKTEEIIKIVLRQVLHREPTIEDAKDCTKAYAEGEPLDFYFLWKSICLGKIVYKLGGPDTNITFEPTKEFKRD